MWEYKSDICIILCLKVHFMRKGVMMLCTWSLAVFTWAKFLEQAYIWMKFVSRWQHFSAFKGKLL